MTDVLARTDLDWVIIDEIQKVPKLLDLVHKLIEDHQIKFAVTGSNSRKLKRGGANLLAGRAFLLNLFPLTLFELGKDDYLLSILSWGSLPKIFAYNSAEDKKNYLISYVRSYVREEILMEQLVRNIEGFRNFLDIAAQMNGKTLNFAKISRETGLDSKTVKEFLSRH